MTLVVLSAVCDFEKAGNHCPESGEVDCRRLEHSGTPLLRRLILSGQAGNRLETARLASSPLQHENRIHVSGSLSRVA